MREGYKEGWIEKRRYLTEREREQERVIALFAKRENREGKRGKERVIALFAKSEKERKERENIQT